MKKTCFLIVFLVIYYCKFSTGQVLCIYCYDQNDSISNGITNLIQNGGFENNNCAPTGYCTNAFCPGAGAYSCDITNWTCTGGGNATYACILDSNPGSRTIIVEGYQAAYLGNSFCHACSSIDDDTSCLNHSNCTITGIPAGYPVNSAGYGLGTGVSIEQTVSGLIAGNAYVLEFWAGGEVNGSYFPADGLFAVDVGFGDTLLADKPTSQAGGIGTRYIIEFKAASSTHIIKFTSWDIYALPARKLF